MTRKTKLSEDFKVSETVRVYCQEKWGLSFLADVFLEDFRECFQINERKHANWETTFKAYIRNNSPSGRFYNVGWWEKRTEQARRYKGDRGYQTGESSLRGGVGGAAPGKHEFCNKPAKPSTWIPSETGRETLKHIRTFIK